MIGVEIRVSEEDNDEEEDEEADKAREDSLKFDPLLSTYSIYSIFLSSLLDYYCFFETY